MQSPDKTSIIEKEAIAQLERINQKTFLAKCKNVAKKIMKRAAEPKDMIFWPAGMLMLGLTEAGQIEQEAESAKSGMEDELKAADSTKPDTKDGLKAADSTKPDTEDGLKAVEKYHDKWKSKQKGKVRYVDDALAGYSLLRMYETFGDSKYLDSANRIYSFLKNTSKNSEDSIIYNVSGKDDFILADGAGMTALFLSYYGYIMRSLGVEDESKKAFNLASLQLINYKNNGIDNRSGLPYHGYSLTKGKLGILGWGRAVGWIMMGLAGCVSYLPVDSDQRKQLIEWSEEIVKTVVSYQRDDGSWAWDLPCMEGHVDASATGMIGWSIKKLTPFMPRLTNELKSSNDKTDKALLPLTESSGKVLDSLSACEDLAVHRQVYGVNAWGQGAALACLKA